VARGVEEGGENEADVAGCVRCGNPARDTRPQVRHHLGKERPRPAVQEEAGGSVLGAVGVASGQILCRSVLSTSAAFSVEPDLGQDSSNPEELVFLPSGQEPRLDTFCCQVAHDAIEICSP